MDRYQHAWGAGRGDPWRVDRMRIARGEPGRGDDRGALVRCRVTRRDEALIEPHLDADGAADHDGVERAPAGVLALFSRRCREVTSSSLQRIRGALVSVFDLLSSSGPCSATLVRS
ncbi:hypothetical protein [Streptomyces chrestomyceticus]|uniref:hypothetical protein n=1 Tax=Streptomyces chrestomyceticus TaxID=68185 RepID=UPI00378FCA4C